MQARGGNESGLEVCGIGAGSGDTGWRWSHQAAVRTSPSDSPRRAPSRVRTTSVPMFWNRSIVSRCARPNPGAEAAARPGCRGGHSIRLPYPAESSWRNSSQAALKRDAASAVHLVLVETVEPGGGVEAQVATHAAAAQAGALEERGRFDRAGGHDDHRHSMVDLARRAIGWRVSHDHALGGERTAVRRERDPLGATMRDQPRAGTLCAWEVGL